MIKIIDIDQLFDKYIHDYVYQNVGKIKPEEIENNIPILYEKFGNESLKELNGLTPNIFYESYKTEELIALLRTHVEQGVAVSDFLCEAISKRKSKPGIRAICLIISPMISDENRPIAI